MSARLSTALAAISTKLLHPSMRSLSSLQAAITNFTTNFISSGLSGSFLFDEALPAKVTIVIGAIALSKSSVEKRTHTSGKYMFLCGCIVLVQCGFS